MDNDAIAGATTKIIESIAAEENTEVRVYEISRGYSVAVHDLDADRGMVSLIFPHTLADALGQALSHARELANV